MTKYKKIFTALLTLGVLTISTPSFAYSQSFDRKIERLQEQIDKQQEKIQKVEEKRYKNNNSSSNSTSYNNKTQKYRDKITKIKDEMNAMKADEDKRISKKTEAVQIKITQSKKRITQIQESDRRKLAIDTKNYENKVKRALEKDPTYKAEPFVPSKFNGDKSIDLEKAKIAQFEEDIKRIKDPDYKPPKPVKNQNQK